MRKGLIPSLSPKRLDMKPSINLAMEVVYIVARPPPQNKCEWFNRTPSKPGTESELRELAKRIFRTYKEEAAMASNLSESKQRAIDLISSLTEKECSVLLRLHSYGTDCMKAYIKSGVGGYDAALRFVEEWEAQHERA